jgi:antitoxin VapB
MALNIKNDEAHALAKEIAERTGVTLTEAVLMSLREMRATVAGREPPEGRAEALLEYGRRLRQIRSGGNSDTSDLYDAELGLPT